MKESKPIERILEILNRNKQIKELPVKKFTGESIDNCFYVDDPYNATYAVNIQDVFNYIKEKAISEGLEVILKEDRIILKKYESK